MPDRGLRLLICTAPEEVAPTLARALLEARLIGCANLVPALRSLYWWEGEIQSDSEVLMLMECLSENEAAAVAALTEAHPYAVPKILTVDPTGINEPYLEWLRATANPS